MSDERSTSSTATLDHLAEQQRMILDELIAQSAAIRRLDTNRAALLEELRAIRDLLARVLEVRTVEQ